MGEVGPLCWGRRDVLMSSSRFAPGRGSGNPGHDALYLSRYHSALSSVRYGLIEFPFAREQLLMLSDMGYVVHNEIKLEVIFLCTYSIIGLECYHIMRMFKAYNPQCLILLS